MYAIQSTALWVREAPDPAPLVEALLFDVGVPLSIRQIAERLELSEYDVGAALDSIRRRLDANDHGIALVRSGATAALAIRPEYQSRIRQARQDGLDRSRALIQEYLHVQHQRGRRPKTLESYKLFMERFADELGRPIDEATTRDIRRFLMAEEGRGNKLSTLASKIHRLSSLYGWLEREEYIDKNPMKRIDAPTIPKGQPRDLSHEEIEQIRDVATGLDRLLFEVLYSSGIRREEVVLLDWPDIDFAAKSLVVREGKGGKSRVCPLSTRAVMLLRQHQSERTDGDPCVFRSQFKRRMSVESVNRRIRLLGERAGLQRRLTPHRLRHSFATHLLAAGMPMEMVQELLGHEDVRTTQVYARTQIHQIDHFYRRAFA